MLATKTKTALLAIGMSLFLAAQANAQPECLGDCNGNDQISVAELIVGVNIALGLSELSACPAFDNGSGNVSVSVLITAVRNALAGCGGVLPTSTPTLPAATATPEETPAGNAIFQGALPRTNGRFAFQAEIGLSGADAECASQFAGAHVCTGAELAAAASAGELAGAKDMNSAEVTSFWVIDSSQPEDQQCQITVPWDYATAHLGCFGQSAALDNASGDLAGVVSGTICATQHWVGCCK